MKVLGYVRLSRASREESTSVTRQREIIRKTCLARDFELVDILEDVDVSATKTRLDRPGLSEVRRRIAHGEAEAVLVWRLDRLARSVVDIGVLLDEGLQIISATESLDTTSAMGRAMVEILQVFASMEAKTTGARVSASQEHLRRVGRWPGGVLPYGYRVIPHPDGPGKALAVDPAEAAVVRRMADEVLGGASVYAVCRDLNRDGIRPRRASEWSPKSITRILRSDSILGRVRVRGELLRDDSTGLPAVVWPPLLSVEEVERLRALTDWTPTPGRSEATSAGLRRKASRLLSGLMSCPSCGSSLVVRRRKERAFYVCPSSARGKLCERGVIVDADMSEAEIERRFLATVGRYEVIEERISKPEVAGLAAVEEALRETTDALRSPEADMDALLDRLALLRSERDRLAALPSVPVSRLEETGETFAQAWDRLDVNGRRQLLESSGLSVTVRPGVRGTWSPDRLETVYTP